MMTETEMEEAFVKGFSNSWTSEIYEVFER